MKRTLLFIGIFVYAAVLPIGAWNYFSVYRPVSQATRNQEVRIWVHFQHYISPSVLSFDLRDAHGGTMMDVFVVLRQSTKALSSHHFKKVELRHHGDVRFILDGVYFNQLGNEYAFQNPFDTITGRTSPMSPAMFPTFTSHLYRPDGVKVFTEPSNSYGAGYGLIGMLSQMREQADQYGEELDQFHEFSKRWYLGNQ
jgi:hypothetical protein